MNNFLKPHNHTKFKGIKDFTEATLFQLVDFTNQSKGFNIQESLYFTLWHIKELKLAKQTHGKGPRSLSHHTRAK